MILHSIFIQTQKGVLCIPLSGEYKIEISQQAVTIDRVVTSETPRSLQRNIASLHTLFGANGSGKTEILLRIVEGLGRDSIILGKTNISVLYSAGGELQLFLASPFQQYQLRGSAQPVLSDIPSRISSVLYTSSPYENARRSDVVRRARCIDVSPHYGNSNKLDGLSLLALQQEIPGHFIGRARMGIGLNLLTASEIHERVSAIAGELAFPMDPGLVLRALLHRDRSESLRVEATQLRILCSLADIAAENSPLSRVWVNQLAQLIVEVTGNLITSSPAPDPATLRSLHIKLRKDFLNGILKKFEENVRRTYRDAPGIVKTLQDLSVWLNARKRGLIQATPAVFEKNLSEKLPDRESLHRCGVLGLVTFSVDHLSSGETALAVFCAALYGGMKRLSDTLGHEDRFFLVIDEGEMFLHPKWQREYIGTMLKIVELFPKISARAHILLSTHSLIVAADTPPNGLIDIDKAKVVNGFGLGPKGFLEDVYSVEKFSGEYTNLALSQLAEYFGTKTDKISKSEALLTAQALADENIREYLVKRIEEENGLDTRKAA